MCENRNDADRDLAKTTAHYYYNGEKGRFVGKFEIQAAWES